MSVMLTLKPRADTVGKTLRRPMAMPGRAEREFARTLALLPLMSLPIDDALGLGLGNVYKTPSGHYVRVLGAVRGNAYLAAQVHLHSLADMAASQLYISARYSSRLVLAWTAKQWLAKQVGRAANQLAVQAKRDARELQQGQDDSRTKAEAFQEKARIAYEKRLVKSAEFD